MQVSFNDLLVGFFCSGCEALSYGFLSFLQSKRRGLCHRTSSTQPLFLLTCLYLARKVAGYVFVCIDVAPFYDLLYWNLELFGQCDVFVLLFI